MKKAFISILIVAAGWQIMELFGVEPRFAKLSDHCYYLQLQGDGSNVAAVITDDGILLINPPAEGELATVAGALAKVSTKAIKWIVFTEPGLVRNAGAPFWAERNPVLLDSAAMDVSTLSGAEHASGAFVKTTIPSRLTFERQVRLFPSDLEIRVISLQQKARTGADIVIFVPAEKVLFVGGLYEAARYPDIDTAAGGNAVGWFDGMKQVIDSVPVLKTAIPALKPIPKSEPEKTLEEGVTILSSRGAPSNLQNMKDLLESAKKLHNDIARAIKAGRTSERFLASSAADVYRTYTNLDSFAGQLFDAMK